MQITRQQLRQIIKEEGYYSKLPKWHVDGQSWPGSLEDLAREQGRTWGHGAVVDKKGFASQVTRSRKLAAGTDGSPLQASKKQLRRIIREELIESFQFAEALPTGFVVPVPEIIQTVPALFSDAGLTPTEIARMPVHIAGNTNFYGTPEYKKLAEYFAIETGEMSWETYQFKAGDPDLWILDKLEGMSA